MSDPFILHLLIYIHTSSWHSSSQSIIPSMLKCIYMVDLQGQDHIPHIVKMILHHSNIAFNNHFKLKLDSPWQALHAKCLIQPQILNACDALLVQMNHSFCTMLNKQMGVLDSNSRGSFQHSEVDFLSRLHLILLFTTSRGAICTKWQLWTLFCLPIWLPVSHFAECQLDFCFVCCPYVLLEEIFDWNLLY